MNHNPDCKPNEVLSELNRRIIDTFKQEDGLTAKDGMDISICIIDKNKKTINYSGAYNPLLCIKKGELLEISADKKPIGGDHFKEDRIFTVHEMSYDSGDTIYMMSDGFVDQFGGDKKRKYMKKRFKNKLLDISPSPLTEQCEILKTELKNWMGNVEQVDDIAVMGIRLK